MYVCVCVSVCLRVHYTSLCVPKCVRRHWVRDVRDVREEREGGVRVVVPQRGLERRDAVRAARVGVGAQGDERLHRRGAVLRRGKVQHGARVVALLLQARPGLH